jgi:excisionase family DNA binding protein
MSEPGLNGPTGLLDIPAVAARLGVAIKTVRRMIDRGELPSYRVGGLIRVSEPDFDVYIASCRRIGK